MRTSGRSRRLHRLTLSASLALAVSAAISVVGGGAAYADSTLCSGYSSCITSGHTDHGYGTNSATSYWGAYPGHNCTNYVAYVETQNGVARPSYSLGGAYQWWSQAAGHVPEDDHPAQGAVAWWGQNQGGVGSDGHIAYVESVNGDGSITISEDAYPGGPYDWMTITPGSARWPGGFIHFKDLMSGLGGGAGSSWAAGRLDAWVRQAAPVAGSNLGHIWVDGAGWHPWETIPTSALMASSPAVVSWGVGRIDVFARGIGGDLIHEWLDAGGWHGWESLGGCIQGSPTVTSWAVSRLDVFAQSCDPIGGTNLVHIWYQTVWHTWEMIPASQSITSSPSAVSWGTSRIDLFARGTDTSLLHGWLDASGWHMWESLGGCIVGVPAASSWGPGRLDGWVQACTDTGANFVHIFWDAAGWHPFEVVGPARVAGVLGAASWGVNRIDLLTLDPADHSLDHWWYGGAGFLGPESLGGSLA